MPNNVNAQKALRQSKKRRLHNRSITSTLRTAVKKARAAATSGDEATATDAVKAATKKLDQAAAKHLIHKNAAARTKSRLSKLLKKKAGATK
jgi:small subunit ribosomal protein S20